MDDDTSRSEFGFFGNGFRGLEFERGDVFRELSNAETGDKTNDVASEYFPADLGVNIEKDVASNERKTGGKKPGSSSGVSNDVQKLRLELVLVSLVFAEADEENSEVGANHTSHSEHIESWRFQENASHCSQINC